MKHIIKSMFALSIMIIFIGCEKYHETPKYEPTANEIILGTWWNSKWHFEDSNSIQEFNNFEIVVDFLDDGTGYWRIKENDGEISISNFTWHFLGKYLILEYEDNSSDSYVKLTQKFILNEINIKEMILLYSDEDVGNVTFFFRKRHNSVGRGEKY